MDEIPASAGGTHDERSFDRELNRRIVRNSAWAGLGFGGGQIVTLVGTLLLVRLLDPAAFGTVAIGIALLAVVSQIQESGLGAAFVHGRHRDPNIAASSVLVFAAATGFVFTAVTVAVAPVYTWLLHAPESTAFVQVLALMLSIRGLAVVPGALLERELDFRSRTWAELSGAGIQATTAIGCALAGLGAWSLVAGYLGGAVVQGAIMWLRAPWWPSPFNASRPVLREMLRYGRFVSGANVMVVVNTNIDNATVARFLGTGALGAYNIAWRLAELPATMIGVVVGRVMFSVYSRLQHDLAAVRAAYIQNLQRTMVLALPVTVTLCIAAEPIVLGLLGPKWQSAIGPLRLLAVFGLVRVLAGPSGELFKGIGRPHLPLVGSVAFFATALPALLILVPRLGSSGAALAMVIGISVSGSIAIILTLEALSLRACELARALARPAACGSLVGFALLAALPAIDALGPLAALGAVAAVSGGTFLVAMVLVGRPILSPIWVAFRRT